MNYPLDEMYRAAVDLARESGEILSKEFHRPGGHRTQGDGARVDYEVEDLIRSRLTDAFPDTGFRSEERPEFNRTPANECTQTWLVDPHDGTTAAMSGQRGASVSIGLIDEFGRPCVGVVFAYAYPNEAGDLIAWHDGMTHVMRNDRPASTSGHGNRVALVSRSADRIAKAYGPALHPYRYQPMPGIAYRLALAAVGDAEVAISLGGPRDFDCAGGHALLIGAGYELLDERGRKIRYKHDRPSAFGFCYGGSEEACVALSRIDWNPVLRAAPDPDVFLGLVRGAHGANTSQSHMLDRAQGAWFGQLCGDALGSQVEFQTSDEIHPHWPHGVNALVGGGPFETIAGQPTDDSEMALVLARQLVAAGDFNVDLVRQAYVHWYQSNPFDVGQTVKAALSSSESNGVLAGELPQFCCDSQANGALMRVTPIGIAGASRDESWTASAAAQDARLTHPHPTCVIANQVFALTIRKAIVAKITPRALFDYARTQARALDTDGAILQALEASKSTGVPADMTTHMSWVLKSFQCAFSQLLRSTSAADGVSMVVSLGGDTDTNGCITGALLGAVYGLDSWPHAWRQAVMTCRPIEGVPGVQRSRPKTFWPVDALPLAEALVAGNGVKP